MFIYSLPDKDFCLAKPLEVFSQGATNKCEAYAATSIGEDKFGIKFDPDFTFDNALKISGGRQPNMEEVCLAVVEFGLLPKNGGNPLDYRAKSFEKPWGFMSQFDIILGAMKKGFPVLCGVNWQQEWTNEPAGIVRSNYQNYKLFPHAVKAFGQKTIDGEKRIMILNSLGDAVGHNGIFYLSKDNGLRSPYIIEF